MLGKYQFLLALKLLEYEIKELRMFSRECCGCFELLKTKLDYICQFMNEEENMRQWGLWGSHTEIRELCEKLRETSVKALCDMEKYQSVCIGSKSLEVSRYINSLAHAVQSELRTFGINRQSKLLFIGAGAFPITALTIARETGASVMCLDIDPEAVQLAKQVAKASGLEKMVRFSIQGIRELDFSREASHVIIASLVKNKLEVLNDLKATLSANARILLRYGNGLKSIFNYPLEANLSAQEWVQTPLSQSQCKIYDAVILEKAQKSA